MRRYLLVLLLLGVTQFSFLSRAYGAERDSNTAPLLDSSAGESHQVAVEANSEEEIDRLTSRFEGKSTLLCVLTVLGMGLAGLSGAAIAAIVPRQRHTCPPGYFMWQVEGAIGRDGTVLPNSLYPLEDNGDVIVPGTIWDISKADMDMEVNAEFSSLWPNPNPCVVRGYWGSYEDPEVCVTGPGPTSKNFTKCGDVHVQGADIVQPSVSYLHSRSTRYLTSLGAGLGALAAGVGGLVTRRSMKKDQVRLDKLKPQRDVEAQ